jgi:acetyl-CoA C-acetyltransferase
MVDAVIKDGLWCAFESVHMGSHAELTARKSEITREEQDRFALESHRKAVAAIESGKFGPEIVPVEIASRKGTTVVDTDEAPRADTTLEALGKLRPAFTKDGTVTAGNAPGLNDGASALVVTSEAFAVEHGLEIMARITGYASAGTAPELLFYAPVFAVRRLMEQTGRAIGDYELIEANEAFAVQALADGKELGWEWDRVNVHGGAVALGHPIGASGARVLTTLLYALRDRGRKRGLATLCLGGGNAVALEVEAA